MYIYVYLQTAMEKMLIFPYAHKAGRKHVWSQKDAKF